MDTTLTFGHLNIWLSRLAYTRSVFPRRIVYDTFHNSGTTVGVNGLIPYLQYPNIEKAFKDYTTDKEEYSQNYSDMNNKVVLHTYRFIKIGVTDESFVNKKPFNCCQLNASTIGESGNFAIAYNPYEMDYTRKKSERSYNMFIENALKIVPGSVIGCLIEINRSNKSHPITWFVDGVPVPISGRESRMPTSIPYNKLINTDSYLIVSLACYQQATIILDDWLHPPIDCENKLQHFKKPKLISITEKIKIKLIDNFYFV
ncbi:hypothetical protein BLOT_015691 [Blomia tropicalis]|nr:hypothetical protein BLOT_015691 [Blomia tropicalis]